MVVRVPRGGLVGVLAHEALERVPVGLGRVVAIARAAREVRGLGDLAGAVLERVFSVVRSGLEQLALPAVRVDRGVLDDAQEEGLR